MLDEGIWAAEGRWGKGVVVDVVGLLWVVVVLVDTTVDVEGVKELKPDFFYYVV